MRYSNILVTSLLASRTEAVTDTGVGYLHNLSVTQVSNGVRMSYIYDEVFLYRISIHYSWPSSKLSYV